MKKVIMIVLSLFSLVVVLLSFLLFTSLGNDLLKKFIEKQLEQKIPVKTSLEQFSLFPLKIRLKIANDSLVLVQGKIGFDRSIDLKYDVKITDLAHLKKLINANVRGPLNTSGTIQGTLNEMKIAGASDIAQSQTFYKVYVKDFEPKSVDAKISHANLPSLLYMVYQPPFVKGALDVDARLKDLDPKALKGDVVATIKDAIVDRSLMKKEFGVDLPSTTLRSDTHAKLLGDHIDLDSKTRSNLLSLDLKGSIKPEPLYTDIAYTLKITKLELLKPITKADIRGSFNTHGRIKGSKKEMIIGGFSDVASSATNYRLVMKDFTPKSLVAKIEHMRLSKLLYMIKQPIYADGFIKSDIKLSSLDPKNLHGTIVSSISKGRTKAVVLKKEFNLNGADITFRIDQKTSLNKTLAVSDIIANTSVANLKIKAATFDLNKATLEAPYTLYIPDLNRLYFLTNRHMKGNLRITGTVKKEKDLIITAHSDTLGGKFDAKLLNDDLDVKVRGIEFTKLTDMLLYDRIFASSLNADLRYNIVTKKGKLQATALNGRILPNKMSFLLSQMAKFDITKEVYKKTTLTSDINDKIIVSDLDMISRLTHISTKRAKVDLGSNTLYAKLRVEIQGRPVYVKLKGKLDSPNITIDAGSIVKERAKKVIEKKLKKQLGDKVPDVAKNILKLF